MLVNALYIRISSIKMVETKSLISITFTALLLMHCYFYDAILKQIELNKIGHNTLIYSFTLLKLTAVCAEPPLGGCRSNCRRVCSRLAKVTGE